MKENQAWGRGDELIFRHVDFEVFFTSMRREQDNSQVCGSGTQRKGQGWSFKSVGHLHVVVMHKEEI